MKKKNKWSTFVLLSIFFVGLSVMLYPAISSYWNTRSQSQAIVDYEKMLESIPKEISIRAETLVFNEWLKRGLLARRLQRLSNTCHDMPDSFQSG